MRTRTVESQGRRIMRRPSTVLCVVLCLGVWTATASTQSTSGTAGEDTSAPTKEESIEVRLKEEMLSSLSQERRTEVAEIMKEPPSSSQIRRLAGIMLGGALQEGEKQISSKEWHTISSVLAHLAKTRAGEPIAEEVKGLFEQFFARAVVVDGQEVKSKDFWGNTAYAVARYGTEDLLTDSFWKECESSLRFAWAPAAVGGQRTLERMRRIRDTFPWNELPKEVRGNTRARLNETIRTMEMSVQYPELREIPDMIMRYDLGLRLEQAHDNPDHINECAAGFDDPTVRRVFSNIAERIRGQLSEPGTPSFDSDAGSNQGGASL